MVDYYTGLYLRVSSRIILSHFSAKTYVVGTQKNRHNEAVLLSTQTYAKNYG